MDTSYSYQDSLHLLNDSEWNKLSGEGKGAIMQSIENEVARREGRPPCNVSLFSEMPKNGMITAGQYNRRDGTIRMNDYHLRGVPSECLDTILHEGRHAYQDKAVKGEIQHHDKNQLTAWQKNLKPGNYIDAEKNRRAYYRQPIEADAREYASITSRQIQAEQKVQNETNKGITAFREKSAASRTQVNPSPNKGIQSFRERTSQSVGGSASAMAIEAKSESQRPKQSDGQDR